MVLHPVPAFSDNYIWVLHNAMKAVVVDPGESDAVLGYLQAHGLQLEAILVTHHHADHTGGVQALRLATGARLLAPATEWLGADAERVADGFVFSLLGLDWHTRLVPGHTLGHVAYVAAEPQANSAPRHNGVVAAGGQRWLFCGDTLFSAGCGRLFEGSPAQMLASLDTLSSLPDNTWVCCTHEYTLGNLRFARLVEPGNEAVSAWLTQCEALRQSGQPTLPAVLWRERQINPFLRTRQPTVMRSVRSRSPGADSDVAVFAALREWKNEC